MTQTWLVISDLHVPFHDRLSLFKICKVALDLGNELYGLIINGDFFDLFTLATYNADSLGKLRGFRLEDEYEAGRTALGFIESSLKPHVERHFLYGNHEDRYIRTLDYGDLDKLSGTIMAPEEALRLHEKKYKVYPNWKQDFVKLGSHLEVTHGVYTPVHAAKKHLDEFQGSVLVGHTHRFQTYLEGKRGAWNVGFLGDLQSPGFHYVPRTARNKWVQSFALVTVADSGDFWVEPIQIHNGKFICRGKMY